MHEYNRWESRYAAATDYLFGTAPNAFLAAQRARLPKGGRALAVADGDGRNGVWLAEQGLEVLSLDFSPSAQEKANALARSRGVTLRTELADATQWPWPTDHFDLIVLIFAQFTSPSERERLFEGIRQALRAGGLLLIEGYGPKQLEYQTGGPAELERLYTRELLAEAFGDFTSITISEYDAELCEGNRHTGTSALIDLVATK
jgi:SAM-dependent methyltransferase